MPRFEREPSEFVEKVVSLNRVSKTVKGGRVMKFSALVVVGDEKGKVGFGLGKAAEVPEAIRKGLEAAKKNMFTITLSGTTIPHEVVGEFGAGRVLMWISRMSQWNFLILIYCQMILIKNLQIITY